MSNKELVQHAKDLAELFQDDGEEVSHLDILDNLATLGLTLTKSTSDSDSSGAYIEALSSLSK